MSMRTPRACTMLFLLAVSLGTAVAQEKPLAAGGQMNLRAVSESEQDRSEMRPIPTQRYPRYLLRPSDVLHITFPISPEFDQTVAIQPDGYISLRGVGDLYIEGKSIPELTEALRETYGTFLHVPLIDVELKDFEKPYFIAGGEFGHPGKYELRGDTTVAEAVAIAGGFTDKAKHSEVVVFRRAPDGWAEARRLDVKQMLASKDLSEDIHLRPGDLIYVPQNRLSKIRQYIPNSGMGFTIP
jgi:polysaccharide export outer membrane protein